MRVAVRSVCGGIGGSSVAKILVADDNSNIQKMVVLALKDQGIEVVAVGNGEAAVRKISDLKPDLVLADIFMPVRSGYEVCKFVKDDPALSHIPVILLVGAFDPLDEQEASRVGADGVLKKPFVPPDPLISMVKAALARAGVAVEATTSTPPPPMPSATQPQAPPLAPLPKIAPPAPVLVQDREEDLGTPVFSAPRPAPLTIASGAQPLAFGSLLETATPDDDAVFAISSSTHTAPDRNWGNPASAEQEEEPEETSTTGSWRISSAINETVSETPAGQTDWREAAFSGIGSGVASEASQTSGWAPSIEKNSLAITEEEAAELAQKRDALPAIGSSPVPEDWRKQIEEVLPSIPQPVQEEPAQKTVEAPWDEPFFAPPPPSPAISEVAARDAELSEIAAGEVAAAQAAPSAQPEASRNVNSWMAGSVSPWEAELERASQLTSTWDAAKIATDQPVEQNSATEAFLDPVATSSAYRSDVGPAIEPSVVEAASAEESLLSPAVSEDIPAIESLLTSETKEFLQEETAHVIAEEMPLALEQASVPQVSAYAAPVISEPAALPSPAPNMDEIVAKVLARMNPEVLQAVTREILKPLVEAMIKDELSKK